MTLKNIIFSILVLACSSYTFSQSDISLLVSTNNLNKLTLEWRKPISDKMKFKIGSTMGGFTNTYSPKVGDVRVINDTIVQQFHSSNERRFALKLGFERQIKTSVFYYGFDLFTGYQTRQSRYFQTFTPVTADSMDVFLTTTSGPNGSQTARFISIGGLTSFGMNLPINESLIFNVSLGIGLDVNYFLNASNELDPLSINGYTSGTNLSTYMSGTAGIRYKFSKPSK